MWSLFEQRDKKSGLAILDIVQTLHVKRRFDQNRRTADSAVLVKPPFQIT